MIDTERLASLENILVFTQKMHNCACDGDWELLISLEVQRSIAIKSFFSLPSIANETKLIRETIKQVMSLDKEIYRMAKHQQDQIGQQLNELSKNRSAANAYLKNAK